MEGSPVSLRIGIGISPHKYVFGWLPAAAPVPMRAEKIGNSLKAEVLPIVELMKYWAAVAAGGSAKTDICSMTG
jgi:hypothetical protein